VALEDAIVAWSTQRPAWQQHALRLLARGADISKADAAAIADALVSRESEKWMALSLEDFATGKGAGRAASLRWVEPVEHVNALLDGQRLTFDPNGLTVVYGDNASGKSGYARLLKQVVRARRPEIVLTDIFEDRSGDEPAALIGFAVDSVDNECSWPGGVDPMLRQIGYYDEPCGDSYISTDSAVTYRPAALVLLDELIHACDAVRDVLDAKLTANSQRKIAAPENAAVAGYLSALSPATTQADIDEACRVGPDINDLIARAKDEEGRLRASDPRRERTRLTQLASRLRAISEHIESFDSSLGSASVGALLAARQSATDLRRVANSVSRISFESEPLPETGGDAWRALWEAARHYSEHDAYSDKAFPVTDLNARCVLCQQELSAEAEDRFHRFRAYMTDDSERQAAGAQRSVSAAISLLGDLDLEPGPIAVAIATVEEDNPDLADRCREAILLLTARRDALLAHLGGAEDEIPELVPGLTEGLDAEANAAIQRSSAMDSSEVERLVSEATRRRTELEERRDIAQAREQVEHEIERLVERSRIEAARRQTDTTGITRKSTDLAREGVTDVVRDRFTRESHDLRLERITLRDVGGRKGQLMQRPAFLGASQPADIPDVLSEGEQTALGIAGFLTEAHFDNTKSTLVLDDPVSSLDHIRRAYVAGRLSEFARDRQVIVFTHDISFIGDLRNAAQNANVAFAERCVERRGDRGVGYCTDQHPWKAKDAKARLGQLDAELARIKRERSSWDSETYEKEVADWAGRLSETWERIVNLDIVYRVVDRGTAEVRPKMFRMLAEITDDDNREFQVSYSRCSQWARRHDKSPDINYVAPDTNELNDELALVRAWHARISRYGS